MSQAKHRDCEGKRDEQRRDLEFEPLHGVRAVQPESVHHAVCQITAFPGEPVVFLWGLLG
jgi:hypothetical protein